MTQIYHTPLPDADARRADKAVASAIEQAGLLEQGGVATENVATENVDLVVEGQFRFGRLVSSKLSDEIDSLSESTYTALPLFDPSASSLGRSRGYYEVEDADVRPAKPGVQHVFEFTLTLTQAGTSENSVRAVATNVEDVTTSLATGAPAEIAIPAAATRTRWYSQAAGPEPATDTRTESSEYGDVAFYDPATSTIDNPTLVYRLPFESDGPTDVRVYDDRDRSKFAETASGNDVNVWTHAYHTGYQFDGDPVIDTGRLRLTLDTDTDSVVVETWDDGTQSWDDAGVTMGDYALADYSCTQIGPTNVRVRVTLTDTTTGTDSDVLVSARRGRNDLLLRPAPNTGGTLPTAATSVFGPVASDQTTDPNPSQGIRARSEIDGGA